MSVAPFEFTTILRATDSCLSGKDKSLRMAIENAPRSCVDIKPESPLARPSAGAVIDAFRPQTEDTPTHKLASFNF
jgi:hypothetical protein